MSGNPFAAPLNPQPKPKTQAELKHESIKFPLGERVNMARIRLYGKRIRLTHAEQRALSAGVPKEVIFRTRRIRRLLRDKELRARYKEWWTNSTIKDITEFWKTGRNYADYNNLFKPHLGRSIKEELMAMTKGKRRPLRILDDGAGSGMFLSQLKEVMGKIKTTAVVLKANLYLLDKKERGVIDEVLESPSEEFIPREKQDAIFSFFGSMEYSLPILKKDVLLKYANLLNRGGIACIGMDLSLYQLFGESKSYPKELEPTKKETQSWKKEDWERYLLELRECEMNQIKQKMRGILRALKKRGFQAEHHYVPKNKEKEMPRDILIIRKPK